MGRARDAVLVHPAAGHEHAADDVGLVARCGDDELVLPELLQPADIRRKRPDGGFIREQVDVVAQFRAEHFERFGPEQPDRLGLVCGAVGRGRDGGERELVAISGLHHFENARQPRAEGDPIATIPRQQDMPARQRRMAAQRDFIGRRAPAQLPIGRASGIAHHESGFREEVLGADLHQHIVGQPFVEHHHRRLIAAKRPSAEGIDVPIGDCLCHRGLKGRAACRTTARRGRSG